jgi:hypothetical protein
MKILVDADSCPRRVRDIIARAAHRTGVRALFVANRRVPFAPRYNAKMIRVLDGESADDRVVALAEIGDLAVTRDIPLAERLVDAGVTVVNDRGTLFSGENVRQRRSERDFMERLRRIRAPVDEQTSFGEPEVQAFAACFDRELTRLQREEDYR